MLTDFWPKERLIPTSRIAELRQGQPYCQRWYFQSGRMQVTPSGMLTHATSTIISGFPYSAKGSNTALRRHRLLRRALQRKIPWKMTSLLFLPLLSCWLLQHGWFLHSTYMGKSASQNRWANTPNRETTGTQHSPVSPGSTHRGPNTHQVQGPLPAS